MFPFAGMMDFFFDEFAGLCGWRVALSLLDLGSLDGRFLRHRLSPPLKKDSRMQETSHGGEQTPYHPTEIYGAVN